MAIDCLLRWLNGLVNGLVQLLRANFTLKINPEVVKDIHKLLVQLFESLFKDNINSLATLGNSLTIGSIIWELT